MAKVQAIVVHDEVGRIVSISRPAKDAKVIILSGDGQSAFETEIEEKRIGEIVAGAYRADAQRKSVVEVRSGRS